MTNEGHVAEGDLVRYLDEEMTTIERGTVARHLLRCAECAASLDSLRADRAGFARLLGELPTPVMDPATRAASLAAIERALAGEPARTRPATGRRAALRAAAAGGVLVVSAAAAATSPTVRHAVVDTWRSVVERDGSSAIDGNRETARRIPLAGATIGFIPTSESFVLEMANPQQTGMLILGISISESVTATAVDGREPVDLVVLPDGMRIENDLSATGDYAVSIPRHLREIRIRVGDGTDRVLMVSDLSSTWVSTIDLSTGWEMSVRP